MATQVNVKSPKMFALVLMIGGFMGLFSETALNMALTDIMADFKVSAANGAMVNDRVLTRHGLFSTSVIVPY